MRFKKKSVISVFRVKFNVEFTRQAGSEFFFSHLLYFEPGAQVVNEVRSSFDDSFDDRLDPRVCTIWRLFIYLTQ